MAGIRITYAGLYLLLTTASLPLVSGISR